MIKTSAHTMATPDMSLPDAAKLFAELGFDGVEIISADDYPCGIRTDATDKDLGEIRSTLDDLELGVSNIVSYVREINVLDDTIRRQAVDDLKRCIDHAHTLGSESVRLWAGIDPEPGHEKEQYGLLIDSMQQLAPMAGEAGLVLSTENHRRSYAVSGAITAGIIRDVGSRHVGVLYDPANLLALGDADYRAAFEVQAEFITHVHFKDVAVLGDDEHLPKIIGEGEVPWEWIIPALVASGYDGYITTEFEKRWHPAELPSSYDGLTHELAALRRLLAAVDA